MWTASQIYGINLNTSRNIKSHQTSVMDSTLLVSPHIVAERVQCYNDSRGGQVEAWTCVPQTLLCACPLGWLQSVSFYSNGPQPCLSPLFWVLSHKWLSLVVTFGPQIHLSNEAWILKNNVRTLLKSSPLRSAACPGLGDGHLCFSSPWELSKSSCETGPMQITLWFL